MTTTESTQTQEKPVKSLIPARMHDMPWVKFHWLVIFGLGTAWILDGLEAQIVAAGGFEKTLDMSAPTSAWPARSTSWGRWSGPSSSAGSPTPGGASGCSR